MLAMTGEKQSWKYCGGSLNLSLVRQAWPSDRGDTQGIVKEIRGIKIGRSLKISAEKIKKNPPLSGGFFESSDDYVLFIFLYSSEHKRPIQADPLPKESIHRARELEWRWEQRRNEKSLAAFLLSINGG